MYNGEWKHDERHGTGTLSFQGDFSYTGQFEKGRPVKGTLSLDYLHIHHQNNLIHLISLILFLFPSLFIPCYILFKGKFQKGDKEAEYYDDPKFAKFLGEGSNPAGWEVCDK